MTISGTYWVIKEKATNACVTPRGVGATPHLYASKAKAEAQMRANWRFKYRAERGDLKVVSVQLSETENKE